MIIQSGSNTCEINRQDFSAAIDRNILPDLEWQEGITDYGQYVNVKICNKTFDIVAIEAYSGHVYIKID